MFVPFHVLLEPVTPGAGLCGELECVRAQHDSAPRSMPPRRSCWLAFGLLTFGLGLVLALPLWVASSYAAWKDIFGIRDAPDA